MKRVHLFLLVIMIGIVIVGCGGNKNNFSANHPQDVSDINNKISQISSITNFPYYYLEESKELISYYSKVINNEVDTYYYMNLTKDNQYKRSLQETDYIYFGELKDSCPNGIGVVFKKLNGLNGTYFGVYDIANFKKGYVNDYALCYIWELNHDSIIQVYLRNDYEGQYENGEISGEGITYFGGVVTKEEYPAINDGLYEVIINDISILEGVPFKHDKVFYIGEHDNGVTGIGTAYLFSGKKAFEGELQNSAYVEGREYYENGQLKYEGKYWLGQFHGKGVLYDEQGNVIHDGKFKKGEID